MYYRRPRELSLAAEEALRDLVMEGLLEKDRRGAVESVGHTSSTSREARVHSVPGIPRVYTHVIIAGLPVLSSLPNCLC